MIVFEVLKVLMLLGIHVQTFEYAQHMDEEPSCPGLNFDLDIFGHDYRVFQRLN